MNPPEERADSLGAEDWSGVMGERWLAHLAAFEGMIAPIGQALITRAAFAPGERVVDAGCGAGATSIDIAQRVGPSGSVVGVDISPVLIDTAKRRGAEAGSGNLEFRCADAATWPLQAAPFDRLFSRFGLMFFEEPARAFANLHAWLRPGGRADFSVWAPAAENAWVAHIMAIVARHAELPPPVPHAPGPFAFDDPTYLEQVLRTAGFTAPQIDTWQGPQWVGGAGANAQQATDFVFGAMHFGRLLEPSGPEALEAVRTELRDLFARHRTSAGIAMTGKAYLVTTHA